MQTDYTKKQQIAALPMNRSELGTSALKRDSMRFCTVINCLNRRVQSKERDGKKVLLYGIVIKSYSDLQYNSEMFQYVEALAKI